MEHYPMKTTSTKVPTGFNPDECRKFLETRSPHHLKGSFFWDDTPQGVGFWIKIYSGSIELSDSDILLLEGWILESIFPQ
jgi:hypothetical protein